MDITQSPDRKGFPSLPLAPIAFHSTCMELMDQMEVELMQTQEEGMGGGVTSRAVKEEGTLAITIKYIDALSEEHFTSLFESSKLLAIYISIQQGCLSPINHKLFIFKKKG